MGCRSLYCQFINNKIGQRSFPKHGITILVMDKKIVDHLNVALLHGLEEDGYIV